MRTFIFGVLALLSISVLAKADIVYDNLNTNPSASAITFGANKYFAQRFTTTSATNTLDWIKINLFKSGGSVNTFSVSIWSNNGSPDAQIASIATNQSVNALGTAANDVWQLGGGINLGTTLTSATSYWLVVQASANDSNLNWTVGPNTTVNYNSSNTGTSGSWGLGSGSLGAQIAVPEPGTLLLGGIAAVTGGGGVWWKRRRKSAGNSDATESAAN